MIEVDEARRLLIGSVRPGPIEIVGLQAARGRVLAREVLADRDFPPTDRSAMDGFAVRAADLAGGRAELDVVGEARAGSPVSGLHVAPGQAARIMTGAIVPEGADAVVMVEDSDEDRAAGRVKLCASVQSGQHVRRRGEDLRRGETVLVSGATIHAPEVAALASVGLTQIAVHRLPRVALLSTGDEIVEPDAAPAEHQIRNSNAASLTAQLAEMGLPTRYLGIAPDEPEPLGRALAQGLAGDLLLVTGGVSAGEYDLVAEALERAGMRRLFHGVSMKPGKPVLAGTCGDCLVVGLPGNPLSTYTVFAVLVAPALRVMTGMAGLAPGAGPELIATLGRDLRARPGRETYHMARLEVTAEGRLAAYPVRSTGSGDVLSMARANGFAITSADCAGLPAGADIRVVPWPDFRQR